jgi:hypothetical protein
MGGEMKSSTPRGGDSAKIAPPGLLAAADPRLVIRNFRGNCQDEAFRGQLIVLRGSCFVWLGPAGASTPPQMPHLALCVAARPGCSSGSARPAATTLFRAEGRTVDAAGCEALAARLTRKSGEHVAVSCSLPAAASPGLIKVAERTVLSLLRDARAAGLPR